ncbi:uncharacterized protein LOC133171606 [Saccostrea echinata]|uniref:uncharacterized protein LOC133171606 n=1 Tax=Saccostrea echinata TaxID=191078 RepID=UPI002A83654C|nr:uncharacterized protein LOC133171606 [Saccostrea echinata]
MYLQLILILAALIEGEAYLCYECTSLDDGWCTEHFVGKDMSSFSHHVVNCTGDCMKMIVRVTSDKYFYVRTCDVSKGFSNACSVGSYVLGIPTSTVCVCSGNHCNAAAIFYSNSVVYFVSLTFFLLVYL